ASTVLNIDGCRVGHNEQLKFTVRDIRPKAERCIDGGPRTDSGIASASPSGRWPANLIHDGSDEVVSLFPITTSGKPRDSVRTAKGMVLQGGGNGTALTGFGDTGSAARFFYTAKASGSDRGNRMEPAAPLFGAEEEEFRNTHPTVKPIALMTYLCKL